MIPLIDYFSPSLYETHTLFYFFYFCLFYWSPFLHPALQLTPFYYLKSEGRGSSSALQHMISECNIEISNLVTLSNSKLKKSDRQRVSNLIIQDSHNKDNVQLLVDGNCCDRSDFIWQSKFRPRITLEVPAKAVSDNKLDVTLFWFFKYLKRQLLGIFDNFYNVLSVRMSEKHRHWLIIIVFMINH